MEQNGTHIPGSSKRVFLVDDQPLIRQALKLRIRHEPGLTVCGEAEDGPSALEMIAAAKPDIAIIDLKLKNSDGLQLIKELRHRCPEVPTLVFSIQDEMLFAERVIRAGASGFVSKQESPPELMRAVRKVLDGKIYWSERAAAQVACRSVCPSRSQGNLAVNLLSDRELQVFEMIGVGATKAQIAAALHIDPSTVETYRTRIKEKLGLRNATELLQHAIRWSVATALR